jgi:ABC-type glycerol-3-phosphate transport system permease component
MTPSIVLRDSQPRGRAASPSRVWRIRKHLAQAGAYGILLVLAGLTGFPLIWVLLTSLKQPRDVFYGPMLPTSFSLSTYQRVWTELNFPRHLANSAFVTAMTLAIVLAAGTLAGYAFARYRFPARDVVYYLFLSCMMVPSAAILVPMFIFLHDLGLLNSLPGLSLSYLGTSLPFAVFVLRAFFLTVPRELGDAGKIDGCTELGVFARIFLPLARPALATVTILQFVTTWNEFMFATTFIATPDLTTLQTELYRYSGNWVPMSAGVVLAITPIVIVYLALQRQFVRGLAVSALQG